MFNDLIGIPYEKMPCYDLVREVYRRIGKKLPDIKGFNIRELDSFVKGGIKAKKLEKPEMYCLLYFKFFGNIHHIGIYLGHGKMIHSSSSGVCIQNVNDFFMKNVSYYKVV